MSQVTIVLANGESQEVTAVSNLMGNTKAFEFRAITPSGEVRTYRGSLADSTFTPVPEGGAILGALEAAFQLDERTILSKY